MKILLVDDVPMYVELLREPLAGGGFSPVVATSAAEARAAFARHRPRLAVVDLHMPDEPGDRLCREMKAAGADAPAVLLMGVAGREEDRRRAERAGCDEFLEKPVRPEVLVAAAMRYLGVAERRPRVAIRVPVLYEGAGVRRRIAHATNLSTGGVFVVTPDPLPRGARVTLEIRLPLERNDSPLRLSARVSWRSGDADRRFGVGEAGHAAEQGMGLEFIDLPDEARAAIERFVARSLTAARVGTTRFGAPTRPQP